MVSPPGSTPGYNLSARENIVGISPMFFLRAIFLSCLFALIPLRLMAQNVPPVVTAPIADATLLQNGGAQVIPLTDHFNDPDTSGVRLTTILGNIDIALYDQRTPITVANFKNYIDSGRYFKTDPTTNLPVSTFIHRSVPGFVIQGGGFFGTVNPADPVHVLPTAVVTFPAIQNEPGISNTRGTIAMARLTDPNTATSQWFINLVDNGGPPNNLDTLNGGFTVFGRVLGDGLTVVDAIAAVRIFNFGAPFDSLPLLNYTTDDYNNQRPIPPSDLVPIPAISYISSLIFTATSDQPSIATAAVSGTNLLVNGKQLGSAKITVTATDADGAQISTSYNVSVVTNPVHLANISTRAVVGNLDAALIGGFIVRGDVPKRIVIRALGPSLTANGLPVPGALQDPALEVHDGSGALIASNNNWQDDPNSQAVIDAGIAPTEPNESALLLTLPSNSTGLGYTAVVQGAGGTTGVGLVEAYDIDASPGSSVLNISTRSDVQTGDNVLIGGFIVYGTGTQRVLMRAIGPSLAGAVANPLSDPTLTLYDAQGVQIDFNDDWEDNPAKDEIIASTIPPTDPKESAVLQDLVPGSYTAIVRGAGNATGTGLVEAYALPPL
jgi:cyclophilin family peptidyl-prolyl cis-trans isomerase